MRTNLTSAGQSRDLCAESIEALKARGVVVLTKAQTATALQVTYRTITAMLRRGEIRFFRIGGKHVRIRMEEALARMERAETGGVTTDGHGLTQNGGGR